MTPRPIPLRPDPTASRDAAVASLTRAAIATGLGAIDKARPVSEHARRWADDRGMELVLRAASSPATLAGNPALAHIAVAFLDALTQLSAGADLLQRGLALNFNGAAQINCPGIAVPTADFVGEGMPIPAVIAPTSAGATLTPHKLAVLTSLTSEMMRNTNAENLVRQVLIESTGPAIDRVLFSTNAGASDRPAGLRYNITGLTPASGTAGKDQIIVDDLQQLVSAVAPVAGNGNIVLIGSPDAAVALQLRLIREEWPILISNSLAAKTVIMLVSNAVVSAVEGAPRIDASTVAEFHRETAPQDIVNASGGVATPVGSLFQTDEVGLRLRWPITWALRDARGIAWMTGVNW
jgi:hypothetical protein